MNRLFRVFVCFLLICALLVNISPIRAKAIAGEAFVLYSLIGIIASILISLGINATYDSLMNSEWANQCVEYLRSLGYDITNGMIRLYALGEGLYGVQEQLVQDVFDALYLSGAVYMEPSESYNANTSIRVNAYNTFTQQVTSTQPFIVYGVLSPYGSSSSSSSLVTYLITAAAATFTISGDMYSSSGSKKTTTKLADSFYYYRLMSNNDIRDLSLIHIPYAIAETGDVSVLLGGIEEISKSDIFELNDIAPEGTAVADGYPEWAANAVPIVNEDTGAIELHYPVDVEVDAEPGTGTGTGSGTVTVPDNVTLTDILAGVLALPQSIGQAVSGFFSDVISAVRSIPAAIADVFTPSADFEHFSISLSDYFPFCIPFDLYDFFSCLNADPVAPVIDWEIPLPTGGTYPVKLDLSVYDPVASLLRTLQLLLFCIGLAFKTRDLIKG